MQSEECTEPVVYKKGKENETESTVTFYGCLYGFSGYGFYRSRNRRYDRNSGAGSCAMIQMVLWLVIMFVLWKKVHEKYF